MEAQQDTQAISANTQALLTSVGERFYRLRDGKDGFHRKNLTLEQIFALNYFMPIQKPEGINVESSPGVNYIANGHYFGYPFESVLHHTSLFAAYANAGGAFQIFSRELKGAIPRALNIEGIVYSRYINELQNAQTIKQMKDSIGTVVANGRERRATNSDIGYKSLMSEFELLRIPLLTQVGIDVNLPVLDKWSVQVMCKPIIKRKKPKKMTKTQMREYANDKESLAIAKEQLKQWNATQNLTIRYQLRFQILYEIWVRDKTTQQNPDGSTYESPTLALLRIGTVKGVDIQSLKERFSAVFQRENGLVEDELRKFTGFYRARRTSEGYDVTGIKVRNRELEAERDLQEIVDSCPGTDIGFVAESDGTLSFVIALKDGEVLFKETSNKAATVTNLEAVKATLLRKSYRNLIDNN